MEKDIVNELLLAVDYFKPKEEEQRSYGYEESMDMAKQRLQALKEEGLNTEDTLKILNAFYDNFVTFDGRNLLERDCGKPLINVENNRDDESADLQDHDDALTPFMKFNAKFAKRPLSQIFKYATDLSAKSGRSPSEEIARLAAQYSEALIDSYEMTPHELAMYEKVAGHAVQMLRRDLSTFFNASPGHPRLDRQSISSTLKSSRQHVNSPQGKRIKVDSESSSSSKTEDIYPLPRQLSLNEPDEWWKKQLNRIEIEKSMSDLNDETLPSTIPYPPSAFFVFPH